MHPPDELMVTEFLPAVRLLVSHDLKGLGLSQGRTAALLGVTQASVSNYLSKSPDEAYSTLARYALKTKEAEALVSAVSEALRTGPAEGVMSLTSSWVGLLGRGDACPRHREVAPGLESCDACLVLFGKGKAVPQGGVEDVATAVELLESSPSFASVMPEVGVNVAGIAGDSDDLGDVVAVPGRLVNVRGRAKARQPPERGASTHLAKVLLLARGRRNEIRGCVNIKHDRKVESSIEKLGLKVIQIPPYAASGSPDPTLDALAKLLRAGHGRFDAIVDPGAKGVESIVYIFGTSAAAAAESAVRVAAGYSAG